jgi:glycopeptide antibiotics resistance protein
MSWTNDLAQFPHTQPSALLVGNVAVYVPVGFFVALGWFRRAGLALLVALAVPFAAEWAQARFLSGDGSTDDFLLNALGLTVGWTLGMAVGLVIRRTRDRPETNQQRGGS